MPRPRVIVIPLLVFQAAELVRAGDPITESEYLAAIAADHPASIARTGARGEARARELRARSLPDPEIEAVREELDPGATETTLGLSFRVPLARGRRIDAARAFSAAADAEIDAAWLELRLELRAAYAAWAVARERRELIATLSDLSEGIQRRMDERARSGEVSGLAARRIRLAVVAIRGELAASQAAHVEAERRALGYLGDGDPRAPVRPDLPEPPSPGDTEPVAVRIVRARIAQVEAELRLARAELFEPQIVAGWKRAEDESADADGPVIGLSFPLPIFQGSRSSRLALDHRLTVLRAEEEIVRRRTAAEIEGAREAYTRLRHAALDAEAATRDVLATVQAVDAAFQLEEASVTDLLDTLRSALDAKASMLDLHEEALAAHRRLEASIGRQRTPDGGRS